MVMAFPFGNVQPPIKQFPVQPLLKSIFVPFEILSGGRGRHFCTAIDSPQFHPAASGASSSSRGPFTSSPSFAETIHDSASCLHYVKT